MDKEENALVMYLQEEAKCPHCHEPLEKIPQRKTRCKNCDQYFFVRTRPSDSRKVIVTADGVTLIDEQWSEENKKREAQRMDEALKELPEDSPLYEIHHLIAKKESLKGNYDVAWGHFNLARESAYENNVPTRKIVVDMIRQLEDEGRKEYALQMTCQELCKDAVRLIDRDIEGIVRGLPPGLAIDSLVKELGYDRTEFKNKATTWCQAVIRSDRKDLEKIVDALVEFAFNRPMPIRRVKSKYWEDSPKSSSDLGVEREIRYCSNCGKFLSEEGNYCPNCGQRTKQEEQNQSIKKQGLLGKIRKKLIG